MKSQNAVVSALTFFLSCCSSKAYQVTSMKMPVFGTSHNPGISRRSFFSVATASGAATTSFLTASAPVNAVPQFFSTSKGIKYAVTKDLPKDAKKIAPQLGDIVAIEYTGYLTSGQVRR